MAASLLAIVLAAVPAAPALKESPRPLLGQWVCTALNYNGKASNLDPCTWEFDAGGKLWKRLKDYDPAEWRYTADPAKAPAQLDWRTDEDTIEAIYRVDGDTLTICYSHDPAGDRPTRFESPSGTRLVLMTFKRVSTRD